MARGSPMEIETQLLIARELGFLSAADSAELPKDAAELGRIINGLVESIRRCTISGSD
jgi:four helix bundle protein